MHVEVDPQHSFGTISPHGSDKEKAPGMKVWHPKIWGTSRIPTSLVGYPLPGEDEPILTNIFQMGWNHQLVERWWTVYFYFLKTWYKLQPPEIKHEQKWRGNSCNMNSRGGALGVSCELWEIHKRNLHNPTNEDCWVWEAVTFLGSHFWSTSNWWCLLDFHGFPMDFGTPATGETCHGHIPWSLEFVAAGRANHLGWKGGFSRRPESQRWREGWSKFERS